jgi:KAP family P-loop domain/IPT/TIG domain
MATVSSDPSSQLAGSGAAVISADGHAHGTGRRHDASQPPVASEPPSGATRGVQLVSTGSGGYRLINDVPMAVADEHDRLGTGAMAREMASMLRASAANSPLVITINAEWGTGKSSLLKQIARELEASPAMPTVIFNAWTADGHNALERLIKKILVGLDRNMIRRASRQLLKQQQVLAAARLLSGAVASFFHFDGPVDYLWDKLSFAEKSGIEMRDTVCKLVANWQSSAPPRSNWSRSRNRQGVVDFQKPKTLVVLIDDLDRCSDKTIIRVCEAVKLYLDVPGLIFVMACDELALDRGAKSVGGGSSYMEKIVQVAYQIPPPQADSVKRLVDDYVEQAGAGKLIDAAQRRVLAHLSDQNPRRIKRIINNCVIQAHLESQRKKSALASPLLVLAVILNTVQPEFVEWIENYEKDKPSGSEDSIARFLRFAEAKKNNDALREEAGVARTDGRPIVEINDLESRRDEQQRATAVEFKDIQEWGLGLAGDAEFLGLLQRVVKKFPTAGRTIRDHLRARPLATVAGGSDTPVAPPVMRVLVPSRARPGEAITVHGANFGRGSRDSAITVNGAVVELKDLIDWSPTKISFRLSDPAPDGTAWPRRVASAQVGVVVDGVPAGSGLTLTVNPARTSAAQSTSQEQ